MQGSSRLPAAALVVIVRCLGGCQSTALRSAKIYIQQDNWPAAKEQLLAAVAVTPEDAEAYCLLGVAYGRGAQAIHPTDYEAARCYLRALELDPKEVRVKRDLAMARLKLGLLEEALPRLEDVTGETPGDRDAWYWLGHAYANLNRIDESEKAFARAAALDARQ